MSFVYQVFFILGFLSCSTTQWKVVVKLIFSSHYLTRGSCSSCHTWRAAGQALDYFSFLQAHTLQWNAVSSQATISLIDSYRIWSINLGLSRNTVSLRLHFICQFYEYAAQQGWVTNLPWIIEYRAVAHPPTFLVHIDSSAGRRATRSVMPRKWRQLQNFYPPNKYII
jgi:hypothetical protein